MTVELTADATLTSEEAAAVRWNLVCPEVVQFSRQLAYFAHDQRLSYPGPTTWTLRVFPCRWQLRLYAPVGGIGGTVTYAPGAAVTTAHIKNTGSNSAVQQVKVGATWSTRSVSEAFTWAGCAAPLPTQTEVLGAFRMCSSARRFLFNRSALADIAIQRRLEEAAKQVCVCVYVHVCACACGYCFCCCECFEPVLHLGSSSDCCGALGDRRRSMGSRHWGCFRIITMCRRRVHARAHP